MFKKKGFWKIKGFIKKNTSIYIIIETLKASKKSLVSNKNKEIQGCKLFDNVYMYTSVCTLLYCNFEFTYSGVS